MQTRCVLGDSGSNREGLCKVLGDEFDGIDVPVCDSLMTSADKVV